MRILTIIITTAILSMSSIAVHAQEVFRHEVGIDVANVITFLSKKKESYLVNYKLHFNNRYALRSGFDIDWSNSSDGYKILNLKLGFQRNMPFALNHWQLYYGADGVYAYWSRNFMPSYYLRWGASPLLGVSYYISPRFSVSTEAGINFLYTDYRNPESQIPEDNENAFDVNIGYVGMLVASYHF